VKFGVSLGSSHGLCHRYRYVLYNFQRPAESFRSRPQILQQNYLVHYPRLYRHLLRKHTPTYHRALNIDKMPSQPYSLRDRATLVKRERTDRDTPDRQQPTKQHKRRTLKTRGCHFVWASDDSVTESDEDVIPPPPKRRRMTKPINTDRASNARGRVHFKQEDSDDESSSSEEASSSEHSTEDSNEEKGDQTECIDGLLHSFYDRYRRIFTVPGFDDEVNGDDTPQNQHDMAETEVECAEESIMRLGEEGDETDDAQGERGMSPVVGSESELRGKIPANGAEIGPNGNVVEQGGAAAMAGWSGSLAMVLYQGTEEEQNSNLEERGGCVFPLT
jgi:hypothetical protein